MLTQKQKKALIRELDSFAPPAKLSITSSRKKAPKPARQAPRQKSRQTQSRQALVQPSQRGVSNVLGQRSDIPLSQSFAGSESIGRVNGSATFTETQYSINPGQAGTFPWLSKEAALWEKYEFDKLEFEFRTTINEFAVNAYGRVILGVDYDAADPPPSSRSQAEISRPVTAQAPYFNQCLKLRKQDMNDTLRKHFVRPGGLPGGADIKMYDVGNLNFGTDGNIEPYEVGELWVHYTGTFYNQILESTSTAPINNQVSWFASSGNEACTTATAKTLALATAITNGLSVVNTAGSMVPPAGNYLVDLDCRSNDTSAEAFSFFLDFQKNGTTVNPVFSSRFASGVSLGANAQVVLPLSVYVTANGTDAFTMQATITGAAGTLTALGICRWTAV